MTREQTQLRCSSGHLRHNGASTPLRDWIIQLLISEECHIMFPWKYLKFLVKRPYSRKAVPPLEDFSLAT